MRRLGSTVARLTALRRAAMASSPGDGGRLSAMTDFGANPGSLDAFIYLPENLPAGAPLVVVLHGCTQSAGGYDRGSGWSTLADLHGFAVLYPQQRRANNSNLCFNWFSPEDARRGKGEARSIAAMIAHLVKERALDPSRVFVTGLSAGGAMTAVMLATYPELFAGGAVIAGLSFATADTLPEALERMRGRGEASARRSGERARNAAPQPERLPSLSVWHGTDDLIVHPANATAIVNQWCDLHGLAQGAGTVDRIDGHRRETWRDASGRSVVSRIDVAGMGHGTPLDTRAPDACGTAGPHMLDAGICSTRRIAEDWGLTGRVVQSVERAQPLLEATRQAASSRSTSIGGVIDDALRAAGLMR